MRPHDVSGAADAARIVGKGVAEVVSEKVRLPGGAKPGIRPPAWWRLGWADLYGPLAILSVVAVVCLWIMNQGVLSAVSGVERSIGSLATP